jgi:23S rRNA (guanosine2251-2'-O)-methyltransferase
MAKPSREYIYGINPVFEVVRAGRRQVYRAYINRATAHQSRMRKLAGYLEKSEIPVDMVEKQRLADLSRHSKDHQGVILKTSPYPYTASDTLWGRPRLLLLDNVEDPHNVGAILRSAEIFGFGSVLLSSKGVPEIYPSVVKVSAGATEFLEIAKDATANSYVRIALREDYQVLALDGSGKTDVWAVRSQLAEKVLVVIGGEDTSVGQYILNNADRVVSIGQRGRINSLNASVAAGICLYALSEPGSI